MIARRFTGWHMTTILIGFFGVVIAVNLVMASSAVRTFGGTVVDNSYVASQRFNGWIAATRAQDSLGWRARAQGAPGGTLIVELTDAAGPVDGALVAIEAEHPLGRIPGRAFALAGMGRGRYAALHALPTGRWRIRIEARAGRRDARFVQDVRL